MSIAITCHGCGQRLELPDDFARRKVRCAACGVYSEIPPAPKKAPAKPAARPSEPAARQAAKDTPPASKAETVFQDTYREDRVAKPVAKLPAGADPIPRPPPELPRARPSARDEDGDAMYRFADPDLKRCPDCQKELPHDATLCTHCGFNLETGKRPVKVYEELHKIWDAGWPFERRRNLFLICEAIILPTGLAGAASSGYWGAFLTPWIFFTVLLAFVLGTYDRLELTRDKRGRVRLTRTWRIFFVARPAEVIDLRNYEGVATGPAGKNMTDWIVCLLLLPSVVLAGLWWIFVVNQASFHVSLTRDHGFPELALYKGTNQNRMKEIAATLHEVAGLPYSG